MRYHATLFGNKRVFSLTKTMREMDTGSFIRIKRWEYNYNVVKSVRHRLLKEGHQFKLITTDREILIFKTKGNGTNTQTTITGDKEHLVPSVRGIAYSRRTGGFT